MGGDNLLRKRHKEPWYELYDGNKPLLVGHKNYSGTGQPFVYRDRVFGLDTDCVTGKALTGLLLPSFRFVSVPSRANHWLQLRQMYPVIRDQQRPTRVEVSWKASEMEDLRHLIKAVIHSADGMLQELQADPASNGLPVRRQAKLFNEKAGTGMPAILLNLARLDQLNEDTARKVLKSPEKMKDILSLFDVTE